MSRRTVDMQVNLPEPLLSELREIAKLAGVSLASVIKIAIATEVQRYRRPAPEAQS